MLGRLIWGHSCNHSILIEEICFLSTWRQPTLRPWSRFRELMQMTPKKGCLKMHFTKRNKAFNFGQESSLVRVVMKSIADVLDKLCLLFILQGLCLFSVLKAPYFFPGLLKFQLFYAKLSLLLACQTLTFETTVTGSLRIREMTMIYWEEWWNNLFFVFSY